MSENSDKMRQLIAMTCPKCRTLLTEKVGETFICRVCRLVWEPPTETRRSSVSSPFEDPEEEKLGAGKEH